MSGLVRLDYAPGHADRDVTPGAGDWPVTLRVTAGQAETLTAFCGVWTRVHLPGRVLLVPPAVRRVVRVPAVARWGP